jgi:hypothetical protein
LVEKKTTKRAAIQTPKAKNLITAKKWRKMFRRPFSVRFKCLHMCGYGIKVLRTDNHQPSHGTTQYHEMMENISLRWMPKLAESDYTFFLLRQAKWFVGFCLFAYPPTHKMSESDGCC